MLNALLFMALWLLAGVFVAMCMGVGSDRDSD